MPLLAKVQTVIVCRPEKKGAVFSWNAGQLENELPGSDLLSHTVTHAVPSALRVLLLFRKWELVSPLLEPPEKLESKNLLVSSTSESG